MADREKFLGFLDMIDGGGAGQRGDEFEGGGIFSMLANLMPINPYGSEDPTRRRARDAYYGGLLGDGPDTVSAAEAAATPSVVRQDVSGARPTVMVGSMPAAQTNRMMDVNVVPTSGPNPRVAEEITRMRNAQRMMDINTIPSMPVEPRPSIMSVGPAQPSSAGVPMGAQPQMQTSMVSGTGFQEGDMSGRIGGGILAGVTPAIAGRESFMPPEMANTMPQVSQSYKSDPQFMSVAQNDATFLSMPEAARQNIYNQYLQRRNMQ
jgi:hypothetical protein